MKDKLRTRPIAAILALLSLLTVLACGGLFTSSGSTQDQNDVSWQLDGPTEANGLPGTTITIQLQLRSFTEATRDVRLELLGPDWPHQFPQSSFAISASGVNPTLVNATVTIPLDTPAGTYTLNFRGVQTTSEVSDPHDVTLVVGQRLPTSIEETSPFTLRGDGVYESALRVFSGELTPFSTYMSVNLQPADAILWFNPNNGGLSLDPNDEDTYTCNVVPRTNLVAATFPFDVEFYRLTDRYFYSTSVNVTPPTNVGYTIPSMDEALARFDPGDVTATYTIEVDPILTDRAGQYAFSVTADAPELEVSVSPQTAPVNSQGDPVTVTITVTRVAPFTVDPFATEITFRATHESSPEMNLVLTLPVKTINY